LTVAIRIGIAGFGNHALGRILPVIESDDRLQLASVWTRSESTQVLLRERGYAEITGDFAQFLAMPVDVVYVASPTGLHFHHTMAILEAGHHVWVEKPIATNLEDVRKLVAMAESRKQMLTEAFMFPWHSQAIAIRQLLTDGTIGKLRHVALTFCFPHLAPQNFRYDPELGGGAFLDHACYLVKALDVYVGGAWTVLGGCMQHDQHPVDVAGAACLRHDTDGVIANLNWGFGSTYVNEIQFVGERGRMLVEAAFTKPATRSCNILIEDAHGKQFTLEVKRENPYERMIEGFTKQLGKPEDWHEIRQDILRHAERYFALRLLLQQCS
jgi:dTDP-3,4-didehydro-2,6-dideoxy-alpha-D-glucose 3-reductase